MKRLKNTSGLSDSIVRDVVQFINAQLGLSGFDVECRNCSGTLAGTAYSQGSSYHSTSRPFVVLRVGTETWLERRGLHRAANGRRAYAETIKRNRFPRFVTPYQRGQHKGRRVVVANRVEALVYIAAHELRHLWQEAIRNDKRKANADAIRFHGTTKGKFSEIDTESFALHELRRWRKQPNSTPNPISTPRPQSGGTIA